MELREVLEFDVDASSPGAARRFAAAVLAGWGRDRETEVVQLLVSEVVTNVIRHARTVGSVTLSCLPDAVRVEVGDAVGGAPAAHWPEPREPSGRGLAIVDALASRWGVEEADTGKYVWFEVDTP